MVVYESQARLSKKSEFRMKETQREVNRSHSIARVYFKILLFISDLMIPIRSPSARQVIAGMTFSIADADECTLDSENKAKSLCPFLAHPIPGRDVIMTAAGNRSAAATKKSVSDSHF